MTETVAEYIEHRQRHIELHAALDELFTDYILHHPEKTGYLSISVKELLLWSYGQTQLPTERPPLRIEAAMDAPVWPS